MLQTALKHIESESDFEDTPATNENVMICCGRMGPMRLRVYDLMEALAPTYPNVAFREMAFDEPVRRIIQSLSDTAGFTGLPFTVYFKNGKVVATTSSIQTMDQVTTILDDQFSAQDRAGSIMRTNYDIIVLGAGPGGLTAGIYAARVRRSALVLDTGSSIGGQTVLSYDVANYPGVIEKSGRALS